MTIAYWYQIILLEIGPNRLPVLAYLRDLMKVSHSEIKSRVAKLPMPVIDGDREYMMRLEAELKSLGADVQVEIKPESAGFVRKQKELVATVELDLIGAQAAPRPPLGKNFKPYGVNLGQFISQFNDRTRSLNGLPVRVIVSIFADRSFSFVVEGTS